MNEKIKEFKKLLSEKRVESFELKSKNPIDLYFKNLRISTLFYEYLHFFEVLLRNKVAKQIYSKWGDWFKIDSEFYNNILKEEQKKQIFISNKRLEKKDLQDMNKVISELSLGFWTSLFNKRYDQTIWKHKEYKKIFPHFSKSLGTLSKELNKIRIIRNRIFHYEQIVSYSPSESYELIYSYLCNLIPKHYFLRKNLKEMNNLNLIRKILLE